MADPAPTPGMAKGLKSYLAMIVSAVIAPWIVKHLGIVVTPDMQLQITAVLVAVVGVAARSISVGPPLEGLRQIFKARNQPQAFALSPQMTSALVQTMAPMLVQLVEKILDQKLKAKEEAKK